MLPGHDGEGSLMGLANITWDKLPEDIDLHFHPPHFTLTSDSELPGCRVVTGMLGVVDLEDEGDESEEYLAAKVNGYFMPIDISKDQFYVGDNHYVEAFAAYEWLLKNNKLTQGWIGVMVVPVLAVHPQLRGKRLGLHLLNEFIETFRNMVDCFVGKPFPLQIEGDEEPEKGDTEVAVAALWKYYKRLGYKKVNSKSEFNYLDPMRIRPRIGSPPWDF